MPLNFEAQKVALKQNRSGFVLTLVIHPDEVPEELLRDFVGARYGVAMVRIRDDESPTPYNNRVQKAGMLCRNHAFWEYLNVDTEAEAVAMLCGACNIQSRAELNGNQEAQHAFDRVEESFKKWSVENGIDNF